MQGMAHMTTSQGRRYRRLQFKRLVARVQAQYQKHGINMQKYKLERNLAEKVVREIVKEVKTKEEVATLNQTSERQAYFEKTYKKLN